MRSQPEVPSFHREGYSQFGGGLEFIRHQIAALGGVGTVAMEHRHFGKSRPRHSMLQPLLGDRKKMKIFEKCGVDNKNQKLQNLGAPCGGRGISLGGRMRSQPGVPSFHREGCS